MELIPANGQSAFDLIPQLSTLEQQAIIRPTNPPAGIAGFLFDVPDEEEMNSRADITDNYVEANFAVQDHIAIKPDEYTVRGFVAELVAYTPKNPATAAVDNALPLNPEILPELTPGTEQEQADLAELREESQRQVAQQNTLWDFYKARTSAPPDQTKQRRAFLYFHALMNARQLFTVETPWGVLYPAAIESIRMAQGPETRGNPPARSRSR
jgi:hypothetical protein